MTGPITTRDPREAADVLEGGGIVAIPTETVYGLAARVHDRTAVERVFAVKGRPASHPLIVHLSRHDDPTRWGVMNRSASVLASRFWPGPLTLLVPRTTLVPDWVTGGRDTVAIRVPGHPLTLELLDLLDDALVAPSANMFGRVSPTRAEHVARDLGHRVDLILDGGPCEVGIESTIVESVGDEVRVLRPGAIDDAQIAALIGARPGGISGESRAPGMLASHYAPMARVVLCASIEEAEGVAARLGEQDVSTTILWESDAASYASVLYERLREADAAGVAVIIAVLPAGPGLAVAIRDRLTKAAGRGLTDHRASRFG